MSNSKKTIKGEFSNMYGDGKNLNIGKNKPVKELLNNIKNSNLNTNQIIENNIKNSKNLTNSTDTNSKPTNANSTNKNSTDTKATNINFRSRITSLFTSPFSSTTKNEKVNQTNDTVNKTNDTVNKTNDKVNKTNDKSLEIKETLALPPISTFSIQSPFKMIYFILIIIILLTIGLLYFYRDMFVHFFDSIFGNESQNEQKKINAQIVKNSQDAANSSAYTNEKIQDTAEKVKVTSEKIDITSAKINDLDKKVDSLITTTNEKCSGKNCPAVTELNNKLDTVSKTNSPKESNLNEDGYCYIGYDNGQRECIASYAGETCMSGEIFPSLDICINPKIKSRPIS